jgi:DNA recombination protein RmuC
VNSIWRYERQSRNAQAIAQQAGQLYDKLSGFVDDLNDVSRKLQAASASHNEAMKKLSSGQGNALSRAQRLKSLGVASKKNFPAVLIEGESLTVLEDDADIALHIAEAESPPTPD